jgi:hypothetical protein
VVRDPKAYGGFRVRDTLLVNLALGDKPLWRMITGRYSWRKKALLNKYFHRDHMRGVEKNLEHPTRYLI